MRIIFALFFSVLASATIHSQTIVIGGVEGDRSLTWNDFTGSPDKNLPFQAYTIYKPKSKINSFQVKGDTAFMQVDFWLEFSDKSWVKKEFATDTLLQHEEGHFSIGKLLVRELSKRMKTTVFFKKDYQAAINLIIKEVSDKYRILQHQYDSETDHGKIREKQWKLDSFLKTELSKRE